MWADRNGLVTSAIIPGAEPRTHVGDGDIGLLVVHGFTGTPASMRPIADAAVAAGLHLEQPLLPGHGTAVADMYDTGWGDWKATVATAADRLAERCRSVVLCGQSMGGTLVLSLALERPDLPIAGIVGVNPMTMARSADELELIDDLIEDGIELAPGEGSDIADPEARDVGYDGTPLRPIRSAIVDGVAAITDRFGVLTVPLLVLTSRHDHVVEPRNSEYLVECYGGPAEHRWLERGFHVAAIDYDRDRVAADTVGFTQRVAS